MLTLVSMLQRFDERCAASVNKVFTGLDLFPLQGSNSGQIRYISELRQELDRESKSEHVKMEQRRYVVSFLKGLCEFFLDQCDEGPSGLSKWLTEADLAPIYLNLVYYPLNEMISVLKFITAAPLACFLKNDLPERPAFFKGTHFCVFRGRLKEYFLARVLSRKGTRTAKMLYSFFQLKRCCPTVPPSFVKESWEKHKKVLSVDPPELSGSMKFEIGVRVDMMLTRFTTTFKDLDVVLESSASASYENNRKNGGSYEEIMDKLIESRVLGEQLKENTFFAGHDLLMMSWSPCEGVKSLYGYEPPTISEMLSLWKKELGESRMSLKDFLPCRIAAVLEPLKVRNVSCGPALPYCIAKPLQRALFRFMGQFWQLSLTHGPLEKDKNPYLLDFLRERSQCYETGADSSLSWLSGDYQGATDSLNIEVTKIIFEKILQKLSLNSLEMDSWGSLMPCATELLDVYRRVLYEHQIFYPDEGGIPDFSQKNGQLMGSILSFPILCIANFVGYWIAHDRAKGYLRVRVPEMKGNEIEQPDDVPVLINGDDLLANTNEQVYVIWRRVIRELGFKLSIGKNYWSKNYLTINSQLYHVGEEITYLPFFNVGLLFDIKKVQTNDKFKKEERNLDSYINEVLRGAVKPARAFRRLVHYHHRLISTYTSGGKFNLCLDRNLGGGGVDVVEGMEVYTTPFQNRLALELFREPLAELALGLTIDSSSNSIVFDQTELMIPQLVPRMGPLQHRTWTLDDLKISHQTNNREESSPFSSYRSGGEVVLKRPEIILKDRLKSVRREKNWTRVLIFTPYDRFHLVFQ